MQEDAKSKKCGATNSWPSDVADETRASTLWNLQSFRPAVGAGQLDTEIVSQLLDGVRRAAWANPVVRRFSLSN
jgi:hypothetical protein